MRSVSYKLGFLLIGLASVACAQEAKQSSADQDELFGPVQSVRTTSTRFDVRFNQPDGPTLVRPIWCYDCDYESDGTRTRQAQAVDGKALGNSSILERDPQGRITKLSSFDLTTGRVFLEEVFGPFGVTKQTTFRDGKLDSHSTTAYDDLGHASDFTSYDADGVETGRIHWVKAEDGTVIHASTFGPHGLHYEETFDPDNHTQLFERFDAYGAIILEWAYADGRYTFWERPPLPDAFGEGFSEKLSDTDWKSFHCHSDSLCDLSHVHYEFQGPGRYSPTVAEWRDSDGALLYAGYCEYTMDATGNWTHRKIWVLSPNSLSAPSTRKMRGPSHTGHTRPVAVLCNREVCDRGPRYGNVGWRGKRRTNYFNFYLSPSSRSEKSGTRFSFGCCTWKHNTNCSWAPGFCSLQSSRNSEGAIESAALVRWILA